MAWLRSLLFVFLKFCWTLILGIFFLPLLLCCRERMGRFVPFVWTGGILWMARIICGIHVRIEGEDHIVRGTALYAMKHQSAFETLFLWSLLPAPVFVLKRELLRIPIFGPYLAGTPIIAIDRKAGKQALASMLHQARDHWAQNRQVIIFPEGTRVPPGEKKPYKSGIYALYEASGLPVIPVALNTGICWPKHRFTKTPGTVTLRFLPPIAPGMPKEAFMAKLERCIEEASLGLLRTGAEG